MLKNLRRMTEGLTSLDAVYFQGKDGRVGKSRFREDVRAIVGGALFAAFVTAAIAGSISSPIFFSDVTWTTIAFVVGAIAGIVGKYAVV